MLQWQAGYILMIYILSKIIRQFQVVFRLCSSHGKRIRLYKYATQACGIRVRFNSVFTDVPWGNDKTQAYVLLKLER